MRINSKYGYKVGDKVVTLVKLAEEDGEVFPVGTELRIVAITPKVRIVNPDQWHDTKQYFYNAVLYNQVNDYSNRVRADFCTIKRAR